MLTEIESTEKNWFLGSEEHLWNTAIKMNLPNLERIIKDKDSNTYKGHRLKLPDLSKPKELSESHKFYVSYHLTYSSMS